MTLLDNNASATAAILGAILDIVQIAREDRWTNEFYTDIVWNVGRNDNLDFNAVCDQWHNYATSIGLDDLFNGRGWRITIDQCPEDDTPLRIRLVGPGNGHAVNRLLVDDVVAPHLREALRASFTARRNQQS
jgi:hypothetical protein